MNDAVGVLIIDEPDDLESTLRATLEHEPALHTFGEADLIRGDAIVGTGAVALVFIRDALVEASVTRIAALKAREPRLRILVAFQSLGGGDLRRLLEAGADAFVARFVPPREVYAAILALAQSTPSRPASESVTRGLDSSDSLTPREAEILRFLSAGFSNKEVARRLSLSVRTVETHRLNLRRKTQTGRLKDLVSLARTLGLAPVLDEPARRGTGEGQAVARHARIEAAARF
jgi:DNA-binding NarL/FixJ family response regulator